MSIAPTQTPQRLQSTFSSTSQAKNFRRPSSSSTFHILLTSSCLVTALEHDFVVHLRMFDAPSFKPFTWVWRSRRFDAVCRQFRSRPVFLDGWNCCDFEIHAQVFNFKGEFRGLDKQERQSRQARWSSELFGFVQGLDLIYFRTEFHFSPRLLFPRTSAETTGRGTPIWSPRSFGSAASRSRTARNFRPRITGGPTVVEVTT